MATLTSMAVSSVLLGVLAYAVFQLAVFMKSFIRRRRLIRKFPTDAPSFIFGHLFDVSLNRVNHRILYFEKKMRYLFAFRLQGKLFLI